MYPLLTQRSSAKIQRYFRFSPPRTLQEFEEKTCETFAGKCYKNSTVREKYKQGVFEDVPGHMRSTKLSFSATVLTLDLKAKIFGNLRLY